MSRFVSVLIFVVCVLAFSVHWIMERIGLHVPYVHAYMDDVICIPVILFPLMFVFRRFVFSQNFVLPVSYIVTAWLILCFAFEVYLPKVSARYTYDPLDMLCYALGGILYFMMQKPFSRNSNNQVLN